MVKYLLSSLPFPSSLVFKKILPKFLESPLSRSYWLAKSEKFIRARRVGARSELLKNKDFRLKGCRPIKGLEFPTEKLEFGATKMIDGRIKFGILTAENVLNEILAYCFFKNNKITDTILVRKLKDSFAENKCLSVNEEQDKEKYQLLLNSLEDKNNKIRAIFAVQKLNEGWDVLNLFDIVRLYETRDGKHNKPGKTTISEAQLIGRGARYFPFVIKGGNDKFMRKYDKDLQRNI